MKGKLYFENRFSTACYSEAFYQNVMIRRCIDEMSLYEAVPEKIEGIFYCRSAQLIIENDSEFCGRDCSIYSPRNGKSGCCRHYSKTIYTFGEKIILKRKVC